MLSRDHHFGAVSLGSLATANATSPLRSCIEHYPKEPSDVRLERLADDQFYWTEFVSFESCLMLNGWPCDELSRLMLPSTAAQLTSHAPW
ncbi:unnamed protein product [Larinioides sclopetarius]|uniref:Uncharacterized protein n=1 Tax=Larinioides sclopetarius TaxID=280406 RepID=A0AAV2BGR5_9ARAC